MARDDWLDNQPTQENEESAISLAMQNQPTQENEESAISLAMQNLNFQDLESLTKLPAQPTPLNQENEESLLLSMQNLNFQDSESLPKLHKTQIYIDIKHRIERAIHKGPRLILQDGTRPVPGHGHPEYCLVKDCHTISEEEYQLVVDCISLSVDIDKEIAMITNFIHHNYSSKFPELESLVHYPVDHARAVKGVATEAVERITTQGIATQMDSIVFDPMQRPYDTIVTLSLEAVATTGELPSQEELKKTIKACDQVFDLNAMKWKIVNFVESRMIRVGPNLAALVGSRVAAKLVTTAGGLSALSRMPDWTIEILGGSSELLAGFSRERPRVRYGGYVEQTQIYWTTIPSLRICVRQDLAGKVALAAQMDSVRGDPTGQTGRTLLEEIVKKVEKMHPKPPAKIFKMRLRLLPMQPKSLPVPGYESLPVPVPGYESLPVPGYESLPFPPGYDPFPGYNQSKKKRSSRHVLAPIASVNNKKHHNHNIRIAKIVDIDRSTMQPDPDLV